MTTGLVAALLAGCQAAPITGRNQFIVLPDSQAAQLGLDAYQQIPLNGASSTTGWKIAEAWT
jgi:hypothetical protein